MISLLEIAKSINEADDDKYTSIGFGRFKLKGKEDDDDADVFVKTDSGKYVKSADQKSDDDGGEKPEQPQGGKLSGSDFERDSGDEPDMDSDDDMDDDKNAPERENEKIEKELQNIAKDKGLTVGSEDANYGGEIHSLVGKDDDPDNALGFHAAPNFDDDGNMTNEPQYAIELGMGSSPMYFDSKEEADSALQKIVDDERIRKAMDGEGDETLFDLGDHAKSIVKDKGEPEAQDPYNPQGMNPNDPMFYDPQADAKRRKRAMNASKDIKMINGKKYKPIKEGKKSKKHILKENYDRFFGDKK